MPDHLVPPLRFAAATLLGLAVVGALSGEWVWFVLALAGQLAAAAVVAPALLRERAEDNE